MDREIFKLQIQRLKNQWPNSYGAEREARIFAVWNKTDESIFSEMIDIAIDTFRAAPLPADLPKLEQEAIKARGLRRDSGSAFSFSTFFEEKYNPANYTDPIVRERVKGRIQLVRDYSRSLITAKAFDEGRDFYDIPAAKEAGLSLKQFRGEL